MRILSIRRRRVFVQYTRNILSGRCYRRPWSVCMHITYTYKTTIYIMYTYIYIYIHIYKYTSVYIHMNTYIYTIGVVFSLYLFFFSSSQSSLLYYRSINIILLYGREARGIWLLLYTNLKRRPKYD